MLEEMVAGAKALEAITAESATTGSAKGLDVFDAFGNSKALAHNGGSFGIIGNPKISPDAIVHEGATVGPQSDIGPDCVVHPGSIVFGKVMNGAEIHPGAYVGEGATVNGTQILSNALVNDGAYTFGGELKEFGLATSKEYSTPKWLKKAGDPDPRSGEIKLAMKELNGPARLPKLPKREPQVPKAKAYDQSQKSRAERPRADPLVSYSGPVQRE